MFEKRNWEKLDAFEENKYDVVLGSDVLFYRGAAPHVAKFIHKSMKMKGCALIADPVRLNVNDFCSRLNDLGCTTYVRQFVGSNESIEQISLLTNGKKSFVKITKAKLVVVQMASNSNEIGSNSGNEIVKAILEMTEPFVEE